MTVVFLLALGIGIVAWIDVLHIARKRSDLDLTLVPRCARCGWMAKWGHRCRDAYGGIDEPISEE